MPLEIVTGLDDRRRRATRLSGLSNQIHDAIRAAQDEGAPDSGEVIASLLTATRTVEAEAAALWPSEAWKSTSSGGPPQLGDLHVKVQSHLVGTDAETSVVLRIATSQVEAAAEGEATMRVAGERLRFSEEIVRWVPLALGEPLVKAVLEHLAYWDENPPNG